MQRYNYNMDKYTKDTAFKNLWKQNTYGYKDTEYKNTRIPSEYVH